MGLALIGINHRTAPVEVRERFSLARPEVLEVFKVMERCKRESALKGAVILSTCNRLEIYVSSEEVDSALSLLEDFLAERTGIKPRELNFLTYTLYEREAVRHLYSVASGLDSMVIGETEILGQVKQAYFLAKERGFTDCILNALFQRAISVGKKVRRETGIDQKAVSVSYAAVETAKKLFGDLRGSTVLVLGAGKMSSLVARYLVENGVSTVFVSNRSFERARELARCVGGEAVRFEDFEKFLSRAQIVISCTGAPHFVIRRSEVQCAVNRLGRDILFIDIAVPRDVDPEIKKIPGVTLYDIDDLEAVVKENIIQREERLEAGRKIIEEEVREFVAWKKQRSVVPTIAALKRKAEVICDRELERAVNRLRPETERERRILAAMANAIVKKMLHDPIVKLKSLPPEKRREYKDALEELFNLK